MIAFWLMPAAEESDFLLSLIRQLAPEYDAPLFEPHVTVYADDIEAPTAVAALREIEGLSCFTLSFECVSYSHKFTKTVFVQLLPSPRLQQLSETLRERVTGGGYDLNPHVSLIYKGLPSTIKAAVAGSINIPFQQILFDRIKVISGPNQTQTSADVEAWRTLAETRLTQFNSGC